MICESSDISPKIAATRLNSNSPTKPQLRPPMIRRISVTMLRVRISCFLFSIFSRQQLVVAGFPLSFHVDLSTLLSKGCSSFRSRQMQLDIHFKPKGFLHVGPQTQ